MTISAATAKLVSRLHRNSSVSIVSTGCSHKQWQEADIFAFVPMRVRKAGQNSQSIREIHLVVEVVYAG
jgi:hypothetical protein